MTPKNEKLLRERYPLIFRPNFWGFECGDGWFAILDALCSQLIEPVWQLEKELKSILARRAKLPENKAIWSREQRKQSGDAVLLELKTALRKARRAVPVAVQVKEKFGALRFHVKKGDEAQRALIGMAEKLALNTCEACGATSGVQLHEIAGWYKTLCRLHAEEKRMTGEISIQRWDMSVYMMLQSERNRCTRMVERLKAELEKQPDVEYLEKLLRDVEANEVRATTINDILSKAPEKLDLV